MKAVLTGLIETAVFLSQNLCPLLVVQHGLKRPLVDATGSWSTIDDPDIAETILQTRRPTPNLAVLLHPKANSFLVIVDVDSESTPAHLQDLGVSREEPTWRWRTGRGGMAIAYHWSGDPLPRVIRAGGLPVDLLTNGYAVVPPSSTHLFADAKGRGGPYRWVTGHTPFDIPLADLSPPPQALLEWWREMGNKRLDSRVSQTTTLNMDSVKAWQLTTSRIPSGQRNDTLTRVAGWLRNYHPYPVVESLLLAINDARCDEPLLQDEVRNIVKSVFTYPQSGVNGHPKALVNPWRRSF